MRVGEMEWGTIHSPVIYTDGSLRVSACMGQRCSSPLWKASGHGSWNLLTPPGTHLPLISAPPGGTTLGIKAGTGGYIRSASSMHASRFKSVDAPKIDFCLAPKSRTNFGGQLLQSQMVLQQVVNCARQCCGGGLGACDDEYSGVGVYLRKGHPLARR